MKKFLEIFRNARTFIKVLQFVSEALSAVAEVYNKYFPSENEKKVEQKDKEE